MKAPTDHGPGRHSWQEAKDPVLRDDRDVVVRVDAVTICGTDLHVLEGDVPTCEPGRVLGHEADAYDVFSRAGEDDALEVALFRA